VLKMCFSKILVQNNNILYGVESARAIAAAMSSCVRYIVHGRQWFWDGCRTDEGDGGAAMTNIN